MRHHSLRHKPDPDARMWMEDGTEFTMLERTMKGVDLLTIESFIEKNNSIDGEYVITPSYICFQIPEEALVFQLTFPSDY